MLRRSVDAVLLEAQSESDEGSNEASCAAPSQRRVRAVRTADGQTIPCARLAAGGAFWSLPSAILSPSP